MGAQHTVTDSPLCPPSCLFPSCPTPHPYLEDQLRKTCQVLSPLLSLPWKPRLPLSLIEATFRAPQLLLGVTRDALEWGRESRWAPSQPEPAEHLPLSWRILIRKGILNSKDGGPFLCSSGSTTRKGICGWLKVTWLNQGTRPGMGCGSCALTKGF